MLSLLLDQLRALWAGVWPCLDHRHIALPTVALWSSSEPWEDRSKLLEGDLFSPDGIGLLEPTVDEPQQGLDRQLDRTVLLSAGRQ
jgi:hypothetical protein